MIRIIQLIQEQFLNRILPEVMDVENYLLVEPQKHESKSDIDCFAASCVQCQAMNLMYEHKIKFQS